MKNFAKCLTKKKKKKASTNNLNDLPYNLIEREREKAKHNSFCYVRKDYS